MNFTRKLTVAALSVSMLLSIPAFGSKVTVEKPIASSKMKAKDYAKQAKVQFETVLKEAKAEKLAESPEALAYKLLNAYIVLAEADQARNGQLEELTAVLSKLGFSVVNDKTKLYGLDIRKINKGYIYNSETAVFSVDKKQVEARTAVKHLQQVMPKEYGVTDFNAVSTSPIAEIKVDVPVPTTSSWMPGKKTLVALTVGLGSIAAYKYTRAGDWADAGFNWADDLSGNRVSGLMAYGSDKLGAGANWMMDTRPVKTAVSAKDSVVGFAKDRYSKFSWPTMDQFKGLFSWGAKAAETVVETPVVAEVVAPVVGTTAEAAFERLSS